MPFGAVEIAVRADAVIVRVMASGGYACEPAQREVALGCAAGVGEHGVEAVLGRGFADNWNASGEDEAVVGDVA
jgi:hypothetical protein